jgi:large subunit GTPase 1
MNAKILYCHPPPNVSGDDFNAETRDIALNRLEVANKKKAPVTRVSKNADTFVPAAISASDASTPDQPQQSHKSRAVDTSFFATDSTLSSRPFVKGSALDGKEYTRSKIYPHQNGMADDGTTLGGRRARIAAVLNATGGDARNEKKHFKGNKKIKQRSGKGYDD